MLWYELVTHSRTLSERRSRQDLRVPSFKHCRYSTIFKTMHRGPGMFSLESLLTALTVHISAVDLFAFQGSHTGVDSQTDTPEVIKTWPTLELDLTSASMGSANPDLHVDSAIGEVPDDADDANVNSILVALDSVGRMHCFLDGSYPLGTANVGGSLSVSSLYKHPKRPTFYAYPCQTSILLTSTALETVTIDIPLLQQRQVRDMAKLSTIVRQLSWYIMRLGKEMNVSWFGSDTVQAARDMGAKWIQGLKARRQAFTGRCLAVFC